MKPASMYFGVPCIFSTVIMLPKHSHLQKDFTVMNPDYIPMAVKLNYRTMCEIRTMSRPPPIVLRVLMAAMIITGDFPEDCYLPVRLPVSQEFWGTMLRHLGGRESWALRLDRLDPASVSPSRIVAAKEYIGEIHRDNLMRVNLGTVHVFDWVWTVVKSFEATLGEVDDERNMGIDR